MSSVRRKIFFRTNSIIYGQDFKFASGIPPYVIFEVEDLCEERVRLKAPGFGVIGNYGNGALHVSRRDIETSKAKEWVR